MSEPAPTEPTEPPAPTATPTAPTAAPPASTATTPTASTAQPTATTAAQPSAPTAASSTVAEAAPKRTLKERLTAHFAEYGRVAVVTYLVLSLMTIIGFSIAIGVGAEPSTATGFLGVIGAGWLAAKATMPLRILAVLAVTPPIAALIVRRKARKLRHEASE